MYTYAKRIHRKSGASSRIQAGTFSLRGRNNHRNVKEYASKPRDLGRSSSPAFAGLEPDVVPIASHPLEDTRSFVSEYASVGCTSAQDRDILVLLDDLYRMPDNPHQILLSFEGPTNRHPTDLAQPFVVQTHLLVSFKSENSRVPGLLDQPVQLCDRLL